VRDNPAYRFISDNAQSASRKFGVKSASLVADKAAYCGSSRRPS
jgi:arsenite methyltransferase